VTLIYQIAGTDSAAYGGIWRTPLCPEGTASGIRVEAGEGVADRRWKGWPLQYHSWS